MADAGADKKKPATKFNFSVRPDAPAFNPATAVEFNPAAAAFVPPSTEADADAAAYASLF